MNDYFNNLNKKYLHPNINKLEEYAKEHNVPIVMKDSLFLILELLSMVKPKRILEIGTAIGYSSICMAYHSGAIIDTIERNEEMYNIATQNIKEFGFSDKINIHFNDALLIDNSELTTYDLIFIDAAKAQNIKFFEKYSPLLNDSGIIVTDNLLFHGAMEDLEGQSKNVRKMVEKIDAYNKYLEALNDYESIFINIGDGISITRKVNR